MSNSQPLPASIWDRIATIDNIAIFILMIVCGAMFWWVNKQESRHREDIKEAWEAVNNLEKSIRSVKYVIAAITGKPPEEE